MRTEPTPVYLIVGCPGSGKSWICNQLAEQFSYVAHDDFIGKGNNKYPEAIIRAARTSPRPVLCETPFSVSQLLEPLTKAGCRVVPVFIIEKFAVIAKRYLDREGRTIPLGHLNRQNTYRARAMELKAFMGTSSEVLLHLKAIESGWSVSTEPEAVEPCSSRESCGDGETGYTHA